MSTADPTAKLRRMLLAVNDLLGCVCDELEEKPVKLPNGEPLANSVCDIRWSLLELHRKVFLMQYPERRAPASTSSTSQGDH